MVELNLHMGLINAVLVADNYIEIGNPLKDAMEDYEIHQVIQAVAQYFKDKGYALEVDGDD
jgi:hypothetical protein